MRNPIDDELRQALLEAAREGLEEKEEQARRKYRRSAWRQAGGRGEPPESFRQYLKRPAYQARDRLELDEPPVCPRRLDLGESSD